MADAAALLVGLLKMANQRIDDALGQTSAAILAGKPPALKVPLADDARLSGLCSARR